MTKNITSSGGVNEGSSLVVSSHWENHYFLPHNIYLWHEITLVLKYVLYYKFLWNVWCRNFAFLSEHQKNMWIFHPTQAAGGGPRVVVSTAAFHARAQGSVPVLGGLKETKNVSSPSTCESQYCGEPPWPRGSVLSLRLPGLEFRVLCLEDSVISIISPRFS